MDLLEIRIKYLYDIVDYFIIIEADETHSGNSKPFILKENIERFKQYEDKILLFSIKMKSFNDSEDIAWKREGYQRDYIKTALKELKLKDTDLILISDLDEIPDKKALQNLKINYSNKQVTEFQKLPQYEVLLKMIRVIFKRARYKFMNKEKHKVQLKFLIYLLFKKYIAPINFNLYSQYYYINYKEKDTLWAGIQCVEKKWINNFSANDIRLFRFFPIRTVNNSGWHFSYLGGKETIKYKIKNFAHQEYNKPEIISDDYIDFCIENGFSLFDYYNNPNIEPTFEKKELTYLPNDLHKIVKDYKKLILE